ncbi:hypothetical protein SAMN04488018_11247 [Myroides marinus]|uniref:Uncharacterized protein n=1 Tax=Myroides marinus TaxID=703342 RepID=A0A1H6W1H5_9FLAO|nr:hypothetical protein [Myroides marinus]SEJ10779.1 hypothetical protein SAMN04488018_11247 [Myroides marinus]
MKIEKKHSKTFATEDTILSATLAQSDEAVLVMSNGDVVRYNFVTDETHTVSTLKDSMGYTDGGFDLTSPISIYTLDDIIVAVNDFTRHGYIFNPTQKYRLHLWRGEYYAKITKYPIALYKDTQQVPHLIYANDWNHVHIMNLNTRQILTAAKSLIEQNAEEEHIEFYKTHEESNKLAWPSSYDYFYGGLSVSPDNKYFTSAGWVWGSFDCCNTYEIEDFIKNNRISDIYTAGGEHVDSPLCWVNNNTIAIAYDPYAEGDEEATKGSLKEIHLYHIENNSSTLIEKIQMQRQDIEYTKMYFDTVLNSFILLSKSGEITVISKSGEIVLQHNDINVTTYNTATNQALVHGDKTIAICTLSE